MSQLGMGVMINMLGGNEKTVEAYKKAIDQTIKEIAMSDSEIIFEFESGLKIRVWDDGQSCCEHRYMNTDDDLSHFIGAKLMSIETREVEIKSNEDHYGVTECEFLIVTTSAGSFTVANYNEHNGYYGGFYLKIEEII